MTIQEVSKLTGLTIRTLRYYDSIGLLEPTAHTEAGYRLYDEAALERIQEILLFRELEFPLKEIRRILATPGFDRKRALRQQIELLTLKKDRLERLIALATDREKGVTNPMDFSAFDKTQQEEYAARAKEAWGDTEAYREYRQKSANRTEAQEKTAAQGLMNLFREFGTLQVKGPDAPEAQAQVEKLRQYITAHYYTCTPEILAGLGQMYAAGGEFTENIDAVGGPGTAAFVDRAIQVYCQR